MTNYRHGHKTSENDGNGTAEYRAWKNMIARCYNPKNASYARYGGRGIKVCKAWREDFTFFLRDMGRKPSPDLSLERVNNNKGYSPDNCVWASREEQAMNRRMVIILSHNEIILPLTKWAKKIGIKSRTIHARLAAGWSTHDALTRPLRGAQ